MDKDWRLKNILIGCFTSLDDRYVKTKVSRHADKVYINFHGLNVPEDGVTC